MLFHIDGIPEVYKYTTEGDYNVMVMELLGPSLEELFQACNRRFSLDTVNKIGFQGMSILANIQKKGFIHRDIKPDNYLIGLGPKIRNVYIIDFGLAKRFIDPQTNTHIFYKQNKNLTGTARYASINTHCGEEQSRRDDFEGMLYVLLYLLKGSLPWQGVDATNKLLKYEKIMQIKKQNVPERICDNIPSHFFDLLCYIRKLNFLDEPDYQYIISQFQENSVNEFDWVTKKSIIYKRISSFFYDKMFVENRYSIEEDKYNLKHNNENSNSLYPRISLNEINIKTNGDPSQQLLNSDPLQERFMSAQISNKAKQNQNQNQDQRREDHECCCYML